MLKLWVLVQSKNSGPPQSQDLALASESWCVWATMEKEKTIQLWRSSIRFSERLLSSPDTQTHCLHFTIRVLCHSRRAICVLHRIVLTAKLPPPQTLKPGNNHYTYPLTPRNRKWHHLSNLFSFFLWKVFFQVNLIFLYQMLKSNLKYFRFLFCFHESYLQGKGRNLFWKKKFGLLACGRG